MAKRLVDDEAEFADRVLALYRAALDGNADQHAEADRDVRVAAFGLAALKQAIEDRKAKYQRDELRLVVGGVYHGVDVVDALTTGLGHPIWKFVAGMRTGRHRPGKATANISEQRMRMTFAAIGWAYQSATEVSEREAAAAVAEGISWDDHQFSAEQVRQWMRRLRAECEDLRDRILDEAEKLTPLDPLPVRILIVGRTAIYHSSATVPGAAQ